MRRLAVPLCLLLSPALQAAPDPLPAIRAAAVAAAPFAIGEAQLDPRIRVAPCPSPLRTGIVSANGQQATVRVICDAPAWQLYVPVRAVGATTVLVLKRPLAAGERISADDLTSQARDRSVLGYGALSDPAQVLERQARRALPAGRILLPGDIIAPPLIRRGDAVTLFIDQGPIHIRMPGVALADGGQGSRIAVRNTRSGRRVEGIVRDAGRVEVPG